MHYCCCVMASVSAVFITQKCVDGDWVVKHSPSLSSFYYEANNENIWLNFPYVHFLKLLPVFSSFLNFIIVYSFVCFHVLELQCFSRRHCHWVSPACNQSVNFVCDRVKLCSLAVYTIYIPCRVGWPQGSDNMLTFACKTWVMKLKMYTTTPCDETDFILSAHKFPIWEFKNFVIWNDIFVIYRVIFPLSVTVTNLTRNLTLEMLYFSVNI